MKNLFTSYLDLVFKIGLVIVIISTLFLFTNLTTEVFDSPKFLILLIFVGVMLISITAKFTLENKVNFLQTPFDLPLILLLVAGIISTVFSRSPYVALLGNNLRIHGSLISLITYVLFYFVLTQSIRSQKQIKWILNLLLFAGVVLSVITLLSYFGIKILPVPWTVAANFTPTGSSFSTTAILAMLLPILVSRILSHQKFLSITLNSLFLILFGITIALTGNLSTWIAALVGFLLIFFVLNPVSEINLRNIVSKPSLVGILASLIIVLVVIPLSFIPPVGEAQNPFYSSAKNFPREIQLGFVPSWKVSISAFRDSPFWGSGPSTYLFNFTTYKPIEFNNSRFWNINFDTAFNEYLQILANLGGVGLLAFLSLTILFLSSSFQTVKEKESPHSVYMNMALAISGIVFFVNLILHSSTLPVLLVGLLIFACFWTLNWTQITPQNLPWFLRIVNVSKSSEQTIRIESLPSILLVVASVLVLFSVFFGGKFYLADLHHRGALNAVAKNNGVLAYNELIAAEKLNPYNDLYRTNLAQVNLSLANAIASTKGPTEASPAGSLNDQDKQNIQVLLQQSINEGRIATTLSPRSAVNWEILALLYRQIAGVAQNALLFSLDSYGRAIFNDPLNPNLRLKVGGVYYAVQNYDLAIRFFTDSINLKPDFANGFYNLSVALRDKGDLKGAVAVAERVVALVDTASPDYKVVSDYLNDLKSKAGGPEQPPAATASGALQEEKLPKVLELPKPEKIATPEAIKKPSPTPSPAP